MIIAGCTEEIVTLPAITDNSLVDPTIQPRVLFTYPPDHGVGLFNVYVPYGGDSRNLPHFVVQFNKLIYSLDISSSRVHCAGFSRPVSVQVMGDDGIYGSLALNVQAFTILNPGTTSKAYYRVGRTYTITLDSTINDINGNRFQHAYSFSFEPEPVFRILDHFLARKLTSGPGDTMSAFTSPWFRLNAPVDSQMFSAIEILPRPSGSWGFNSADSLEVMFHPDSGLRMGASYAITLPQGFGDAEGHGLSQPFALAFHTYPFALAIGSSGFLNGDTLASLSSSIEFNPTGPMDTASFRAALTISPPVDGILTMYSIGYAYFNPVDNFSPETNYVITISPQFRSIFGDELSVPFEKAIVTQPFHITSTIPHDNERLGSHWSLLGIFSNARIDTATIAPAFSITPAVRGHFDYHSNYFYFMPDTVVPSGTNFLVTISEDLKARGGYPLSHAYSFSFTTAGN